MNTFHQAMLRAVVALIALSAAQAHAGAAHGAIQTLASIHVDVGDNGTTDFALNLSDALDFDPATGNVSLNTPDSSIVDATGRWYEGQFSVNGQTYTGIGWHSWQTANGSIDMTGTGTPTSTSNPWATSLFITMNGNVDPEMNYAFFVKNNTTTTQSYTVTFGESLVPAVTGAYNISADISGGVSSVPSSAGVGVTPNTGSGFVQELYLRRVSDGTFVNAGVNVGTPFTVASAGVVPYPSDSAFNAGDTGGDTYDYWEFRTKFKLTGNKDTFAATGTAVLTPVPEPESLALAGAGLAVAGMLARRRRLV